MHTKLNYILLILSFVLTIGLFFYFDEVNNFCYDSIHNYYQMSCFIEDNKGKILSIFLFITTISLYIEKKKLKILFIGLFLSLFIGGTLGLVSIFFDAGHWSKPAVYIYPEKEMDVEVKLKIKGRLVKVIPEYNNGWRMHVKPNGQMKVIGGNSQISYDYIYYDNTATKIIEPDEGWIINKKDILSWHDEFLDRVGLNESEKKEYIDYWIPRLNKDIKGEYIVVKNLSRSYIDEYVKLIISPKPDNIFRLLVLYKEADKNMKLEEPKIKKFIRSGYSVVEWGGILK